MLYSWIQECLGLYKINPGLVTSIGNQCRIWGQPCPKTQKVSQISPSNAVYIKEGHYHPCYSVSRSTRMSALLDNSDYGYRFKIGTTINHLLYMDEIKLYAKNEQDIDSMIHLTRVFSYWHQHNIWSRKVRTPHCQQKLGKEHQWNQATREPDR